MKVAPAMGYPLEAFFRRKDRISYESTIQNKSNEIEFTDSHQCKNSCIQNCKTYKKLVQNEDKSNSI